MPLPVLGEQGAWREQPGGFQPGLEEPGDLSNSSRTWPLSSWSTRGSRGVAEHTVPGQRDSAAFQKEAGSGLDGEGAGHIGSAKRREQM